MRRSPASVAVGPAGAASSFAETYRRLTEVFPSLRVEVRGPGQPPRRGGGWMTAREVATDPGALDMFVSWDARRIERDGGRTARPDVLAGLALHRYAWPACLLMTLPWFLDRRVPRLPADAVSFPRALGRISVCPEEFACLPDDPAARAPGARVVPDEEALRAEVRAAVADHLAPVLAAFGPRMRRRGRALWGMASDEIVESLWYIGHLLGEERRAVTELELLLPAGSVPYAGSAGFRRLTAEDGRTVPTRDRTTCCLFYTLRPDDTCVTCPRTGDGERVRRLRASA
ncbi:(2Fe-2S)-binding protein [Streptomyces tremellae]|uniref:(2Fe-2S)-binding protein n=1 Tax=Streptomyces tremellae TaxID=1124239 RepID=A0ABP7F737_9ACTN